MKLSIKPAAVALALALAACGDDGPMRAHAPGTTITTALGTTIPDELAGTWQTTIDRSRIVDPPDELTQDRAVWMLKFLGTGGEDNGPSMFVSSDEVGEFVHPISLSRGQITLLSDTACRRYTYRGIGMDRIQIAADRKDRGCPSTMISSILQRPWRLIESDRSRRGPTIAETNVAAMDAFVSCAQQHDELGLIVRFRDGKAVSETGDGAGGGEFDNRVRAPRATAALLEDGGQYAGLREGDGPDLDILIYGREVTTGGYDTGDRTGFLVEEEAGRKAVLGGSGGTIGDGHYYQQFLTVSLGGAPKLPERVRAALNRCFDRAAAVTDEPTPTGG